MVANNILNRAFAEKLPITEPKLQKMLYLVASEYQKAAHQPLFSEVFSAWAYGPVLYSVRDKFRNFANNEPITKFARDAVGNAHMIVEAEDPYLHRALDTIWDATKYKSVRELIAIVRQEDSACDKAFQAEQPVLNDQDIAADTTYRAPLCLDGLYHTSLNYNSAAMHRAPDTDDGFDL